MTEAMEKAITQALAEEPLAAPLTPAMHQQLVELILLVVAAQQRLNVTAIREPLAMVRYHGADSLGLLEALPTADSLPAGEFRAADLGTGGGFPLLPLAIARPDITWIGIESINKKVAFVEETARALGLTNVQMRAERAEDAGRSELRGALDLATARAVGPIASLLEVALPLLKIGGRVALYKTQAARAEWEACSEILARLGGRDAGERVYSLAEDDQDRVIFLAEKVSETPEEYPRRSGVPFRKPLVKTHG